MKGTTMSISVSSWSRIIFVGLFATILGTNAFTQNGSPFLHQRPAARAQMNTILSMAEIKTPDTERATLTDETTWRLRLLLNDVKTTRGRKLDGQLFVVEGRFIEEYGYEPPQGFFKPTGVQSSSEEDEEAGTDGMSLELTNSRWKLSEDPDDPKDGLWVWGLFKEPLYPFMLLQMETNEFTLPSTDDEDADSIPPLKLFARINHIRSKEEGTVKLQNANLNVRVLEQVQLPGATVDLYEEEAIGQVSFQPL